MFPQFGDNPEIRGHVVMAAGAQMQKECSTIMERRGGLKTGERAAVSPPIAHACSDLMLKIPMDALSGLTMVAPQSAMRSQHNDETP